MPEPAVHELAPGEVRLWTLALDVTDAVADADVLAGDELVHAGRYRRDDDRRRWTASRAFTRRVLGHHLGVAPRDVAFSEGRHGKPQPAGATQLCFNVSHCAGLAVVAVTSAGEVGVDVEPCRDDVDVVALGRTAFGDEYAARLARLPAAQRRTDFFRDWVRHEASLKCLGTGLRAEAAPQPPTPLWLDDVDLAVDHAAAVAVAACDPRARAALHVRRADTAALAVA